MQTKNIKFINVSVDKSDSKMQENMERIMQKLNIKHSYIVDFKSVYTNEANNKKIPEDFFKQIHLKNYALPNFALYDKNGKLLKETQDFNTIF